MVMWDEKLEAEIKTEFASADDAAVRTQAMTGKGIVARGRAMYELTRRALGDHALLVPALDAIEQDHVHHPKSFPPFGWAAAARILFSEDRAATEALLARIGAWAPGDQQGFFEFSLPRAQRAAKLREIRQTYNWMPGFTGS